MGLDSFSGSLERGTPIVSCMPLPALPTDLTVRDLGGPEGAPLLFLMHGRTDSGECWADAVERWSRQYRLLSWDARGHGESPRFTEAQLADGVAATMTADAVAIL